MARFRTVWYPMPSLAAIRCACSRSATGSRIEMALVALALAFSTSSARTFASVCGIGEPGERKRVPRLSARSNSRCVCRRPSGVVYHAASALMDSNSAFDLRGIDPPFRLIHRVRRDGAESLPANSEHHDQVAARCRLAKQLPALLARLRRSRDDDMACPDHLLHLLGHDLVRRYVPDVVHVPVKTDQVVEHNSSIYVYRIYNQRRHLRP